MARVSTLLIYLVTLLIAKGLEHYGPVSWSQIIMYLFNLPSFSVVCNFPILMVDYNVQLGNLLLLITSPILI